MRSNRNNEKKKRDLWAVAEDPSNELSTTEGAMWRKLLALESLFAESRNNPEWFHQLYVQPLLEEGVSLETAFDLLAASAVSAN
jgi:hypothetical protein